VGSRGRNRWVQRKPEDLGAAYKAIINGDDASKEAMLACIKDTDILEIATGDGRREHISLIMSREPTQMELDSLSSLATVADI
jgi:hypothetical protein